MKRIKHDFWYLVAIIIIVSSFWIRYMTVNTLTNMDEYESLAVPFYFVGIKWPYTMAFHAWGTSIFCIPFILLFGEVSNIYWIFLLESLIIRLVCAIISYFLCVVELKASRRISFIASLVCSIGVMGVTDGAGLSGMSEQPLCLLSLIIAVFLLKILKKPGCTKTTLYGLAIAITLAYGVLIHSRILVLLISTLGILVIFTNKRVISIKSFLIVSTFIGLFFWGGNRINNTVIAHVYDSNSSVNILLFITGIRKK